MSKRSSQVSSNVATTGGTMSKGSAPDTRRALDSVYNLMIPFFVLTLLFSLFFFWLKPFQNILTDPDYYILISAILALIVSSIAKKFY